MDRYLVISSDCHAGLPPERYREYLDPQYRPIFDVALPIQLEETRKAAAKFLVGNRLGPVAAAMFANSPLEAGTLSGFKSRRYAAWLETDRDRTGVSPASLDDAFTIEGFVEYAIGVPMLFVRRDGRYRDLAGRSFARFLAGEEGEDGGEITAC